MNKVTHSMSPVSGLGNQMFQVACAIGYSIKYGHEPIFEFLKSPHEPSTKHVDHCFSKLNKGFVSDPFIIREQDSGLYNEIGFFDRDVSFFGYFQSPKYFVDDMYIKQILSLQSQDKENIRKRYIDVLEKDTVSIHIRRGDYLSPEQRDYHPVLPVKYYEQSLSLIQHDTILCFSDDIKWCRRQLNFKNIFFIEGNPSWEDMYLMSLCNNNIIANSTFSWWAAFLNKNKYKKVIFPTEWFGPKCKYQTTDMFPTSWISL